MPLLLLGVAAVAGARADSVSEKRIEQLFRPISGERMALSTDGHYLAYTQHARGELSIVVMDLERLETKTRILVDEDRPVLHSKERERARLRFLEWADGNRLVFAPAIETVQSAALAPGPELMADLRAANPDLPTIRPPEATIFAPIQSVNADGTAPRTLADAKQFEFIPEGRDFPRMRPPSIRGFEAGEKRENLLIEIFDSGSGFGTDLFRLNVRTGTFTRLDNNNLNGQLYAYDWNGRARMNFARSRDGGTGSISYRATDSSRWGAMPEPSDARADVHFRATSENYFGERLLPLAFDFDPDVLIYAANVGRNTFGIYGMNLKTRQRAPITLEHPGRDLAPLETTTVMPSPGLIFDKFRKTFAGVRAQGSPPLTIWRDPELASVQRALDEKFPQRWARMLEWNETRTRFLVQVTGATDPGRIYLFQRPQDLVVELMRAAPWLPNADLHPTRYFEFDGPNGGPLSGYLTVPRAPRLNPPPLVIWFAPGLPPRPHVEFEPQAQVLADMGFIVCRLNNRGVLGFGAKHRDALRRDIDHAATADALAAIEWIAQGHRIDRKRVATLGEGFAGHLAVRATQLHPEAFRCAVVFDPVIHLASWVLPPADSSGPPTFSQEVTRLFLEGAGAKLTQLSVTAHADELNAPLFIATRSVPRDAMETSIAAGVAQLRAQLKRRDIPCVNVDYDADFTLGLPAARARVYRQLEEFFNLNLYNYNVKIGPTRVVK